MAEAEVAPVARLLRKADRVLDHVAEPNIAALINSIPEPGAANEGLRIASRSDLDGGKLFDDLSPLPATGLSVCTPPWRWARHRR